MDRDKTTKTNQGCCELTSVETKVFSQIFKTILEFGKAPTIKELQISLKKSPADIINVINKLEERDLFLRKDAKKIVSIYPLSLKPTEHQVIMENGKKLFAMCAVDALGIPNMLNKNAKIISKCKWCKQRIIIEIRKGEIILKSHPNILIWSPEQQERPAAEKCCPLVNFFCSVGHLKEWEAKNINLAKRGHGNLLEKGYPSIKKCWKGFGETMRLRGKNL
jgi:hypothetical protein